LNADVGNTEHTVIVGVGGASEVELADGSIHAGANVMLEWEGHRRWLELEIGASFLSVDGGEIVALSTPAAKGTYLGGEVALDFMFWPWSARPLIQRSPWRPRARTRGRRRAW
jgi:hypothetical protein